MPKITRQLSKVERFLRVLLVIATIYTFIPLLIAIGGELIEPLFCSSRNSQSCREVKSLMVVHWLFLITWPTGLPVVLFCFFWY